jgi:hypothetical protein
LKQRELLKESSVSVRSIVLPKASSVPRFKTSRAPTRGMLLPLLGFGIALLTKEGTRRKRAASGEKWFASMDLPKEPADEVSGANGYTDICPA